MNIDSVYSKKFFSNELTEQKYSELYNHAVEIRKLKNKVSEYVLEHLEECRSMSMFDFVKLMRSMHRNNEIGSSFDKQLYEDVLNAFKNKFDAIQRNLEIFNIEYIKCETYKRDTKDHKKGDFKCVINKKTTTELSLAITYLARYGNEKSEEYIKSMINDEKKGKFYRMLLEKIKKFTFERLYNLALSRRKRIIKKYKNKPVEFESLTFRGRSRKKKILDYNKKFGSSVNAFMTLSGIGGKKLDVPVKFSKDFHGSIHDYEKSTPDYEYTLMFDETKKQVIIILSTKGERYIPEAGTDPAQIIGIDVNAKHNMMTLSDGTTYDYDRKILKEYAKLCKSIDKSKEKDPDYKPGKRKQHKLDVLSHKMKESEKQIISGMCQDLQTKGITHIVMEDLEGGFGKSYVKDKINDDLNYNRIIKFLNMCSIKNEVEHIARKYDIAVSTVHACYTSKMCPVCGCIEDENRPEQETFDCVECEYKDNADTVGAVNTRNRVVVTVLRDSLLNKLDNGAYEPKKLRREQVKEVLLSFRRTLDARSGNGQAVNETP